jgi:hypothetical protein
MSRRGWRAKRFNVAGIQVIDPRFTSLDNCQSLQPPNYSGVYFLRYGERILYVGQSKNVARRIADHINKKFFDSILIMPVPLEALCSVETYWIRRLKPVLNRSIGELGQNGDEAPRLKGGIGYTRSQKRVKNLHLYAVHKNGRTYWRLRIPHPGGRGFIERQFSDKAEAHTAFDRAFVDHQNSRLNSRLNREIRKLRRIFHAKTP